MVKSLVKRIQKWICEHKAVYELKKDQKLRERCVEYISRQHLDFVKALPYCAQELYDYIKHGKLR